MDIRWAWAGLLLLAGCGGGDFGGAPTAVQACSKNETAECACPGGTKGAQTCLEDLSAFGKCECAVGGGTDAGGDGAVARDPVTGELVETWTKTCVPTGLVTGDTRGCDWTGGTAAAPVAVHKVCNVNDMPKNCVDVSASVAPPSGQAFCVKNPDGPGTVPTFQICNL